MPGKSVSKKTFSKQREISDRLPLFQRYATELYRLHPSINFELRISQKAKQAMVTLPALLCPSGSLTMSYCLVNLAI
jgi:hypothetical protein